MTLTAAHFRSVLGTLPTGVSVVTACSVEGQPVGMTVGSLSSVSLDPPLVSFMANRGSATLAHIVGAGRFCANVLSDEQEEVCRVFAGKGPDKFDGLSWRAAGSGAPILTGCVAWIDCEVEAVHVMGDHELVLGRVRELSRGVDALPLVFLQGAYGRVGLRSFAAWHEDLLAPLRLAELARPRFESLANELGRECILTAPVQQELVLLASAATPSFVGLTRVGQRMPFVPPLGSLFVAWAPEAARKSWLSRVPAGLPEASADKLEHLLTRVRERGFTAGIGRAVHVGAERLLARSDSGQRSAVRASAFADWDVLLDGVDPERLDQRPGCEIRSLAVPIFDEAGSVALSVGVHGLDPGLDSTEVHHLVTRLSDAAGEISEVMAAA